MSIGGFVLVARLVEIKQVQGFMGVGKGKKMQLATRFRVTSSKNGALPAASLMIPAS